MACDDPAPQLKTIMANKGISEESMLLRRHLLSHNVEEIIKKIKDSKLESPVGLVVDTTDQMGKQLTYAIIESIGVPKHEIPETLVKYTKNEATPTFLCVTTLEVAKKVLDLTSGTAVQNLGQPVPKGRAMVVIVGGGGNSYALVPI